MTTEHVYRVTVRGRFDDLDQRARAFLEREKAEHDIFKSAFTSEGTFTYDDRILFFNLRYEIRTDDGYATAMSLARAEAESFLQTMGFGFKGLTAKGSDVSEVWETNQ